MSSSTTQQQQLARLRAALPELTPAMAESPEPIRLLISTVCPEIIDGSEEYHALIDELEQQAWWRGESEGGAGPLTHGAILCYEIGDTLQEYEIRWL